MRSPGPKRKGHHLYKGELAKPLLAGVYFTDKMKGAELDARLQQAVYESRVEKLALLMEHYGIADKTDYFALALKLAIVHVPGFRIARASELLKLEHGDYGKVLGKKRGRPPEWTPEREDSLLSVVERTKREYRGRTDREALNIIARRTEWSRPADDQTSFMQWIKTLDNRLKKARRQRRLAAVPRK
jgi:hypothetical protein